MEDSEIRNFFKDQTVFITGGTGFLGKVLIEKLLRLCDIRKIFVLVRPKKEKTTEERLNDFFSYACFDNIKNESLDLARKVCFIHGDCELPNLGITEESREVLIEETTIVFHAAANVKFDQPLRVAAQINVGATGDILGLAKSMPNIKAFVYVSTAFSHCPRSQIDEKFYDPPMTYTQLMNIVQNMDEDLLANMTPNLIGQWPNTYSFSKSIAEDLVRKEAQNLPITIIRPAIVTSTHKEPIPGWIDNFYGISGITFATGMGVLRSLYAKKNAQLYAVPCDYVVNAALAAAWNTYKERPIEIPIYNYVGPCSNKLTMESSFSLSHKYIMKYPTQKMLWYNTCSLRENLLWHKICIFFYHTVVAYLVDFVLICCGRKALAVKNYERIHKLIDLVSYFVTNEWIFGRENVENLWLKMNDSDKRFFQFYMENIDWDEYARICVKYGRIHLVKDPLKTLPQARKKLLIFRILHYVFLFILYMSLYILFMHILRLFW